MNSNTGSRRPLKSRDSQAAAVVARWLSHRRVTPNQISLMSIVFAGLAAACLFVLTKLGGILSGHHLSIAQFVFPLLAAMFIQGRLLCNLFDGMVAVEGGKGTKAGELFNDIPDRISDPILLIAAGYSTDIVAWAPILGWAAAITAVGTAYVRTLSTSLGAPVDFRGPMAKQHRMAWLTLACVLIAGTPWIPSLQWGMVVTLGVIFLGSIFTCARRARSAYIALESSA